MFPFILCEQTKQFVQDHVILKVALKNVYVHNSLIQNVKILQSAPENYTILLLYL